MSNKLAWLSLGVIVLVIGGALVGVYQTGQPADKPELNSFAQCLTQKGWAMYGAYWCSHCQQEKKNFGSAWQYVNYVECTEEEKLCLEKEIAGYPTWLSPTGERYEGEQGLARLAELSSCPLPPEVK